MPETAEALAAYRRYVALGPDRSLLKLAQAQHTHSPGQTIATLHRQMKRWSAEHNWQERVKAIVQQTVDDAEFAERERVRQILTSGLALNHERIARLGTIAELLYGDLTGEDRWLTDVKAINGLAVDVRRPNAAWVAQFRGVLDDIAKEVGQRKPVKEEHGSEGGADERRVALMSDAERADRVAELLDRGRARGAGSAPQPAEPAV